MRHSDSANYARDSGSIGYAPVVTAAGHFARAVVVHYGDTTVIDVAARNDVSHPIGHHSHANRGHHDRERLANVPTPEIPVNPPPGTIQQDITQLGGTSIDPAVAVMPTPNASACAESTTMNLATPATMAPANATGAAATPGVMPPGC